MFTTSDISKKVTANVSRRSRQLGHLLRHCHWFIHDDEFFDRRYPAHNLERRRLMKPIEAPQLNDAHEAMRFRRRS